MKKKKSGKSKVSVRKSKASTGKDTKHLDQQYMELQKSSPNSLKEEAAAGRFKEQYFATVVYKFRGNSDSPDSSLVRSKKKRSSRNVTGEQIVEYLAKQAQEGAARVAKKIISKTVSSYPNDSNPNGDSDLNEIFVWRMKIERNGSHEQKLVDAWPELESAAEKHGLCLTFNRVKRYIAMTTTPRTRDPDIFNMAKEFIQILVKTSIPPSVAIRVLNGDLHHDYVLVGHQRGGLCLEHGIKEEQFHKRWGRFIDILKGNSIVAVGQSPRVVKLNRRFVEACIVDNLKPASLLERIKVRHDRCIVERQVKALSL
ncbi:hypothetical protein M0R45_023864 [Rubus argutus]|uniref:KRR1 small subunit processome component first KH domain-containing protein n=1 Tax=Rubus argutus TaxID=59490 RepID=A0AAW1WPU3_RUBAR